jgi:hypothetical protein
LSFTWEDPEEDLGNEAKKDESEENDLRENNSFFIHAY